MSTIRLDGVNIEQRYGFIMSSKDIGQAEPNFYFIPVPSGKTLDITEAIYGDVSFKDRKIEVEFTALGALNERKKLIHEFVNKYHGKRCKIKFGMDGYYFLGRANIKGVTEQRSLSIISVEFFCDPYKYDNNGNDGSKWEWDSFSFVNGIIYPPIESQTITRTKDVNILGRGKVRMVISCKNADNLAVTVGGKEHSLYNGENVLNNLDISSGKLTFKGNGTVEITYRGVRV